jgi:exonuclease-1
MAHDIFAKCVDVTPEMAYQLIKALRREKVAYIVAPYEADAQLAYLERCNVIDAVVTEDSDLLVFGCRTVSFSPLQSARCKAEPSSTGAVQA